MAIAPTSNSNNFPADVLYQNNGSIRGLGSNYTHLQFNKVLAWDADRFVLDLEFVHDPASFGITI